MPLPVAGAPVSPGQKVTYTIKVNQQGKVPVPGASIDDDLTDVIDTALSTTMPRHRLVRGPTPTAS